MAAHAALPFLKTQSGIGEKHFSFALFRHRLRRVEHDLFRSAGGIFEIDHSYRVREVFRHISFPACYSQPAGAVTPERHPLSDTVEKIETGRSMERNRRAVFQKAGG